MSETTLATSQTADAALAADERLATKEGRSNFGAPPSPAGSAPPWNTSISAVRPGGRHGVRRRVLPRGHAAGRPAGQLRHLPVGFVARPIGALVFGWIGDRKGRRVVLITTVALMGLSTTLIGLIPSYAQIGVWAPTCLVILRFAQGFGAGAEPSGGAVMLAEYAPAKRRGLVASIIAIGSNSGTLLASLVWLLVLQLDKEDLMSWGWRIPFLASILIAGVALYLRRHVRETPVFERELQQNHQRMLTPPRPHRIRAATCSAPRRSG